jgi:small subunit ribosomal protein S17
VPGQQKVRNGVVVSDKMDKTVVVLVERLVQHVQYKKYVKQRKKYKAHDPENRCKNGDFVTIVETRPLSREKRWLVREIIKQAAVE